jgi:hypothetical protein
VTTQTGPPSPVTACQVTEIFLPLSARPGFSFLELHYARKLNPIDLSLLTALRTEDGRWYRDQGLFATPSASAIEIGSRHTLTAEDKAEAADLTVGLLAGREPIGSALVEKTSVFLEPDSTVSIVATIRNTTGRWLFGIGTRADGYDALGIRVLTSRGTIVAEHRFARLCTVG